MCKYLGGFKFSKMINRELQDEELFIDEEDEKYSNYILDADREKRKDLKKIEKISNLKKIDTEQNRFKDAKRYKKTHKVKKLNYDDEF